MLKKLINPFQLTLVRILLICFLLGGMMTACNSDTNLKKGKKPKIEKKDDSDDSGDDADDPDKPGEDDSEDNGGGGGSDSKIAKEICNCMDDVEAELSDDAKSIVIKASKSSDPTTSLQRALQNVDDPETQQQIGQELKQMDEAMQGGCLERIDTKYKLKNVSKKRQQQLFSAIEDNCSDFVTALMRIGIKTQGGGGGDDE